MNQEESEQNEVDGMKKGADSTGKVMHYVKERLVICNEEDTDGISVGVRSREKLFRQLKPERTHVFARCSSLI